MNAPAQTEAAVPAEVRYRMLVEQIPAVTYIADFTAAAPFLYVSPQIEELLGFPVDSWIANDDLWEERLHPEDRERVLAAERLTYERCDALRGRVPHARRGRPRGLDLGAGHDHPRRATAGRSARRACWWT